MMKHKLWLYAAVLLVLLCLAACGQKDAHTHNWNEATCCRPEKCLLCGEIRGEALTHIWVDATCTKARHCSLCDSHDGEPIDHTTNGRGKCLVCNRQNDTSVILTANYINPVYDGVSLGIPYHGIKYLMYDKVGMGVDYTIYDQNGDLVVQGKWEPIYVPSFPLEIIEQGGDTEAINYTEFIPLEPGRYTVKYSYYPNFGVGSRNPGELWPYIPVGDIAYASTSLTVK